LHSILPFVNADFEKAVHTIYNCLGRVVISGIGKSAIIAQKIVATLNSTGTPSTYLHAADAIHGDLGMVQQHDIVIIISKSGNSPEIKVLVPLVKNMGNTVIAIAGNNESFLATQAHILINTTVSQEACPNNLAPTSSTTAQMAMGDAIAICLMEMKGFGSNDFAKFHPGGALGKQLYLKVADLYGQNEKPKVQADNSLKDVILSISKSRLGATVMVNQNNEIEGIITDGDLRRMLQNETDITSISAAQITTKNPSTINPNELAITALDIMRQKNITQLIVAENNNYLGIIHLHDIVREGLV
jgi:arabinose-5-phosphate isomerase